MYWEKKRQSYEDDCACIIYFTTVNVYEDEGGKLFLLVRNGEIKKEIKFKALKNFCESFQNFSVFIFLNFVKNPLKIFQI
jgi:hypothetical protein